MEARLHESTSTNFNIKENSRGSEETSGILHEHGYLLVLKFTNHGVHGLGENFTRGGQVKGKATFTKLLTHVRLEKFTKTTTTGR
jgi:hypothetical protein